MMGDLLWIGLLGVCSCVFRKLGMLGMSLLLLVFLVLFLILSCYLKVLVVL